VARFLVLATGGAGGDLPPLLAAGLRLRDRGHEVVWVGDPSVRALLGRLSIDCVALPAHVELGPRLAAAVREAMTATGGDIVAAGARILSLESE